MTIHDFGLHHVTLSWFGMSNHAGLVEGERPDRFGVYFTMGCHLDVVVKLECLYDPKSYAGGSLSSWQV